ncbi:MAG: cell division protein FtsH, partial [Alphaproteobacteria bacterium]
ATNRPDVLDPALLRPGRFDRHVELNLPTLEDRVAILGVHVRNKPLAADVDLKRIASGIPGFSGADIHNLVNEAAISAARERGLEIATRHFDEARDRIVMGTVRTLAIQPEERHRLAVHESGHTAVAWLHPDADPLYKVTIIPRGRSLGATHFQPEEERHTLPVEYLRAQLVTALGGRAAEKVFLGGVSSGADDDIRRATRLARAMVARWGMSEEIGPVDLRESDEHPFLGRELAAPRTYADATAAKVDAVVAAMLRDAEAEAVRLLEGARGRFEALFARLEAEESLDHAAIEASLGPTESEVSVPGMAARTGAAEAD